MTEIHTSPSPGAWIAPGPGPHALRVFGLTFEERLRRGLVRAGVAAERIAAAPSPPPGTSHLVLVRGDRVYDPRLLEALPGHPGTAIVAAPADRARPEVLALHVDAARADEARRWIEGAAPLDPAGLRVCRPEELVPTYEPALRKAEPARVWAPETPEDARRVEAALFAAAYKGVTDLVTAWVWPRPALAVTRRLAAAGVSPNAVTAASWALVVAATALFAAGLHGAGLVAAWLMTFLDTVDGKLARVTLRSSRVGHVLDHGLDLIHPPFWYLAFGLSLAGAAAGDLADWRVLATWWTVAGYVLGRAVEGVAMLALGFELHSWRPLDSAFRRITARRNPNLLLLSAGTLAGRPDLGLGAVAVWTAASLAFHLGRLGAALSARRRGGLAAWQSDPTPEPAPSAPPRGHPRQSQGAR